MFEQAVEEKPSSRLSPRNGVIAFVLSLLLPGLGQIYNGQPKKATILFCLTLFFPLLFGPTRFITFFFGMLVLFLLELALRVYSVIDAVQNANRQKEYILKPYNTWYYHLLIATGMLVILIYYDTSTVLGIQTFRIPTPTNFPTIQTGDFIVADFCAYDTKDPDYGDIVAFSEPDGTIHTYRVVGRPFDSISLVDNIVAINGKLNGTKIIRETTFENIPVVELEEEHPNGHKHRIYTFKKPFTNPKSNINDSVVPIDSYCLLGDSRDNAADSRYLGYIHRDSIKGQVIYSYWGKSLDRINIDFRDK